MPRSGDPSDAVSVLPDLPAPPSLPQIPTGLLVAALGIFALVVLVASARNRKARGVPVALRPGMEAAGMPRRSLNFPVRAFVGPNGGGKTLAMVELLALPAWSKGKLVVSNFPMFPEALGYPAELHQRLDRRWADLVTIGTCQEVNPCEPGWCPHSSTAGRPCVLLLDEMSAVFPSRQSQSTPHQLVSTFNQLRKRDVILGWAAPDWMRCDTFVREVTRSVTECRGFWRDPIVRRYPPSLRQRFPRAARGDDGKRQHITSGWPPNRILRWETYRADDFDEWSSGQRDKRKPDGRRWYWRTLGLAQHAYDTLAGCDPFDHLDHLGSCVICGGKRPPRPPCRCHQLRDVGEVPQVTESPEGPQTPDLATLLRTRNGIPRLGQRT